MRPALQYNWYAHGTPLRKTDCPFTSKYQYQELLGQGRSPRSRSPTQCWKSTNWICADLLHSATSLWGTMAISPVVYVTTRFLWVPSPLASIVFLPLPVISLSLEWRGLMKTSPSHPGLSEGQSGLRPEHCALNITYSPSFMDASRVHFTAESWGLKEFSSGAS